ncbi:MAG: hypothetical protein JSW07_04760 [bacterium]|nr:MAG: hypothetical protein JSW07_04760 [bacterium]
MTHGQIEAYRVKKTEILAKGENVYDSLVELAKEVGASITNRDKGHGKTSEPQLVENIDFALQTASMIETCKTSAENYKIAIKASKTAFWSMIAAWAAIVVGVLIAIFK